MSGSQPDSLRSYPLEGRSQGVRLMDFETVVKRRRMCREYLDRDVPQEKVERILDVASRYPSAGHTEPQEFIVVRDRRGKGGLARVALEPMFFFSTPPGLVVVSDGGGP